MANVPFTILRVEYHQVVEVFFGPCNSKHTLAHCDRVFIAIPSECPPNSQIVEQISYQVYSHRIKQNGSFVSLLEVNLLPQDNYAEYNNNKNQINCCLLVGVVNLPNHRDLMIVTFSSHSLLNTSINKCFELTANKCVQCTSHIISSKQCLSKFKLLIVQSNGWLFVLTPSTTPGLLTSRQYLAIDESHKLISPMNKYTANQFPNRLTEVILNGQGFIVKYGAIVSQELCDMSLQGESNYIFIGELANHHLPIDRIQEQLNISFCYEMDEVWPKLPNLTTSKIKSVLSEDESEMSKTTEFESPIDGCVQEFSCTGDERLEYGEQQQLEANFCPTNEPMIPSTDALYYHPPCIFMQPSASTTCCYYWNYPHQLVNYH